MQYIDNHWTVYIILCSDKTLYTGITTDIERRVREHGSNNGAKYFRGRSPEKVMYLEGGHTKSTASKREVQIKSLSRRQKQQLIQSSSNELLGMSLK
jgi:putative endonuclease